MKTFGEFFDSVVAWAQENSEFVAEEFLQEWKGMVSTARWEEVRAMELTDGLFLTFAEDMANMFRRRIQGICTDAMYAMTLESGHKFLRAIAEKGEAHGLIVALEQVDAPLSVSDALKMARQSSPSEPRTKEQREERTCVICGND